MRDRKTDDRQGCEAGEGMVRHHLGLALLTLTLAPSIGANASMCSAQTGGETERDLTDRPLWGDLQPGPHPVGFRSDWVRDHSRVYDYRDADGARFGEGKNPRPILRNVWYPAAESSREWARLTHGEYFDLGSDDAALDWLGHALADYARDIVAEWALGADPQDMSDWEEEQRAALFATLVPCVRDAPAANGRFPLVLYHSGYGSSFEDNSVFCEYLASYGYVVVGSAFPAERGHSFNIDGKDGSVRDLAFLVQSMATDLQVDWNAVGVVGHSGGAHAVLSFQAQPMAAVDAVISLDTTQDYKSALDPHWRHPRQMLAEVEHQTAPLLMVAKPHAWFQACDALVNAERTYLTFRDLDHNDYTFQGVLTAEFAAERAAHESERAAAELVERARIVRRGFEQCCDYQRLFFDAHLRKDAAAAALLATRYRDTRLGGAEPHVEFVPVGVDAPTQWNPESSEPPSPRQMARWLREGDLESALAAFERLREEAPDAPILHNEFASALMFELVVRGHEERAARVAPVFEAMHPGLAANLLWWVDRDAGRYREEFAIPAVRAAQLLRPNDAEIAERWRLLQDH